VYYRTHSATKDARSAAIGLLSLTAQCVLGDEYISLWLCPSESELSCEGLARALNDPGDNGPRVVMERHGEESEEATFLPTRAGHLYTGRAHVMK